MSTFFLVLTIVFVVSVPALVAYVLFKLSPFAHHADHYRDDLGRRRFDSPHLD